MCKTVTPKQLAANRANALKSTGPRTAAGRARSARNATRHGVFVSVDAMAAGDVQALAELRETLRADRRPVGAKEKWLVDVMAEAWWRWRLVLKAETEAVKASVEQAQQRGRAMRRPGMNEREWLIRARNLQEASLVPQEAVRLGRYETQWSRQWYRALGRLERVQAERRAEKVFFAKRSHLEEMPNDEFRMQNCGTKASGDKDAGWHVVVKGAGAPLRVADPRSNRGIGKRSHFSEDKLKVRREEVCLSLLTSAPTQKLQNEPISMATGCLGAGCVAGAASGSKAVSSRCFATAVQEVLTKEEFRRCVPGSRILCRSPGWGQGLIQNPSLPGHILTLSPNQSGYVHTGERKGAIGGVGVEGGRAGDRRSGECHGASATLFDRTGAFF